MADLYTVVIEDAGGNFTFGVNPDIEQSRKVSNLWRVACDIQSRWGEIINRADISDKWAPLAGPGGAMRHVRRPIMCIGMVGWL